MNELATINGSANTNTRGNASSKVRCYEVERTASGEMSHEMRHGGRLGGLRIDDGAVLYDSKAASIMAEIASWSYASGEDLLGALHHRSIVGPGDVCREISVRNDAMLVVSTAFFIRSGNVGVLCFRGTEPSNAINFLTDADVEVVDFLTMGRVHGGFVRNVRAVWPDIVEEIEANMRGSEPRLEALYITGHSLGAAMAVVAAAWIFGSAAYTHWRSLVRGVYTYGQPMVGDQDFARSCQRFERMLFRHVYGVDLVTMLPPLTAGAFDHFGQAYIGSKDGWVPREMPGTQITSIVLSLPIGIAAFICKQIPLLGWIRLPLSIYDHSPNSYLSAFRAVGA